jgi:RES domain-containing protein
MEVYRISLAKYVTALTASGNAARWNSKGKFVVYTASSAALACLENVVHRSGEGLNAFFKVMRIHVPDELTVETVEPKELPEDWLDFSSYPECQKIGNAWLEKGSSAVLKVPSAVILTEYNYLLNPAHPHFANITLRATEDFVFDPDVKQ